MVIVREKRFLADCLSSNGEYIRGRCRRGDTQSEFLSMKLTMPARLRRLVHVAGFWSGQGSER